MRACCAIIYVHSTTTVVQAAFYIFRTVSIDLVLLCACCVYVGLLFCCVRCYGGKFASFGTLPLLLLLLLIHLLHKCP